MYFVKTIKNILYSKNGVLKKAFLPSQCCVGFFTKRADCCKFEHLLSWPVQLKQPVKQISTPQIPTEQKWPK